MRIGRLRPPLVAGCSGLRRRPRLHNACYVAFLADDIASVLAGNGILHACAPRQDQVDHCFRLDDDSPDGCVDYGGTDGVLQSGIHIHAVVVGVGYEMGSWP